MKILFWAGSFWPTIGGLETHALVLVKELQKRGHQCIVITGHFKKNWPQHEVYQAIPIYRYPFNQAFTQHNLKLLGDILQQIKKLTLQFKPDVMHVNVGYEAHLPVYNMIHKISSIPSIVAIHDPCLHDQPNFIDIYKQVFAMGDQLVCVSNAVLEEVRQYGPHMVQRSSCIYNGLPMPSIQPLIPTFNPTKILCWGRLVKTKGFDLVLRAIDLLIKKGCKKIKNTELIIVGDGVERANLEKLSSSLKLDNIVKFLGFVEQQTLLDIINKATIVVMPSRFEPFGLVAVEAMQLARPVIASRERGLAEIIRHQDTGLLVSTNNVEEIASSIEYLLNHPDAAIQMGQRARADVIDRFSIDRMVSEYEQAYRDVIKLKEKVNATA